MSTSEILFAWETSTPPRGFRSGVSLHSHTSHSLETLAIVSTYQEKNALLVRALRQLERRSLGFGGDVDFNRLYFVPPLAPARALAVERDQIRLTLGLDPLVSLTDHDTIGACVELRETHAEREVPISIEWTVPFGDTYLHLGAHNLPAHIADGLVEMMRTIGTGCRLCRAEQTACFGAHRTLEPACRPTRTEELRELLSEIHAHPQTLVVLNHPCWDMNGLGIEAHRATLTRFFERFGGYIHAVELNGLRPWDENRDAIALADTTGLPIVSGGDRHGCEPAAMLNVTGAASFDAFAEELRKDRRSSVLVMPQYREPLAYRKLRAVCDVLRDDPLHPEGRTRWSDRILYRTNAKTMRSLTEIWSDARGPASLRAVRFTLRLCERIISQSRRVRRASTVSACLTPYRRLGSRP